MLPDARRTMARRIAGFAAGAAATLVAFALSAAEFRTSAEAPALLYDGPSAKARPLFVYGKDIPFEVLVSVEGWVKVRDVSGTIGWFAAKTLADRRVLLVRVPVADVRASPEETATVVFRAEQNVLLELAEGAATAAATEMPGWVKVRHRDGQTGYVRIPQVFGL